MPQARRVGFVMEQTLGHVTHDRNLRRWAAESDQLSPVWMPVAFEQDDRWSKVPGIRSNWTLRASLRARDMVKDALRAQPLDALYFHTQVTALFARSFMRRLPTVVSLDATPLNVDMMAEAYNHSIGSSSKVEAVKNELNRRVFSHADHLITWCAWAKRSLMEDYGVDGSNVTVIPPGIDLERWSFDRTKRKPGKIRLLFVGGDFVRKGGKYLLEAYRSELSDQCELHIVTREDITINPGEDIFVYHGLQGNSVQLIDLYKQSDLFVFPTLGDCLPIAVMEAMAAGLPVISTSVGAISEEVTEGETGLLIPTNDSSSLAVAVKSLIVDPDRMRAFGDRGRDVACSRFCGKTNYGKVLEVIERTVEARLKGSRRI